MVATSRPTEHETAILTGAAVLCANDGNSPDPLAECGGTWGTPNRETGCVSIIDDGVVPCRDGGSAYPILHRHPFPVRYVLSS